MSKLTLTACFASFLAFGCGNSAPKEEAEPDAVSFEVSLFTVELGPAFAEALVLSSDPNGEERQVVSADGDGVAHIEVASGGMVSFYDGFFLNSVLGVIPGDSLDFRPSAQPTTSAADVEVRLMPHPDAVAYQIYACEDSTFTDDPLQPLSMKLTEACATVDELVVVAFALSEDGEALGFATLTIAPAAATHEAVAAVSLPTTLTPAFDS